MLIALGAEWLRCDVRRHTHNEITIRIRASCLWCSRDLLLDGWRRTGYHRVHAAWRENLAPYRFGFCRDRHYSFSQVSLLEQTCCGVECSTSEIKNRVGSDG